MTTPVGAKDGEVEIGALLNQAWRAYAANSGAFASGLILSLLVVVPGPLLIGGTLYLQKQGAIDAPVALALEWCIGAVTAAAYQWIYIGLQRMSLSAVRGDTVESSDIFGPGHLLAPVLVTVLLVQALTVVGLFLCVIPGILWSLSSGLTNFFVIDHGLPAFAGIRASFAATAGLRGHMLVVGVLWLLLIAAGTLLACFGLLVTFPLATCLLAAFYERVWSTTRPNA
jgi:uncharacterized membrane protein